MHPGSLSAGKDASLESSIATLPAKLEALASIGPVHVCDRDRAGSDMHQRLPADHGKLDRGAAQA